MVDSETAITVGGLFRAEKPRLWAEGYIGPQTGQRSFDRPQDRVVFIFNFFGELRRMAQPDKR